MEDRDADKKFKLVPTKESGSSRKPVTLDVLKSAYIAEGLDAQQLADRYNLELGKIQALIESENLEELRKNHVRQGLKQLQNQQISQAGRLLELELNFKNLKIKQLEDKLAAFAAYYARHGDLYKRHPQSGEILYDTNGMPMQIAIPNVTKEIRELKEAVSLSEGTKELLNRYEEIVNSKPRGLEIPSAGVIDVTNYKALFDKSDDHES